jgi:hypothetical protein
MPNENKAPETPRPDDSKAREIAEDRERMNRAANEAAEQGLKREQRYDEDHNIFTK